MASSNHHLAVGDSGGTITLFKCEVHGGQLQKPAYACKLRVPCHPRKPGDPDVGAAHGAAPGPAGGGPPAGAGAGTAVAAPAPAAPAASIVSLHHLPFCLATGTPVLLAACRDGTLAVARLTQVRVCVCGGGGKVCEGSITQESTMGGAPGFPRMGWVCV